MYRHVQKFSLSLAIDQLSEGLVMKLSRKIALILAFAIFLPSMSVLSSTAEASTAPAFCSTTNYLVMANSLTNAASVAITSTFPGALVGDLSQVELNGFSQNIFNTVTLQTNASAFSLAMTTLLGNIATLVATPATQVLQTTDLTTVYTPGFAASTFGPGVYTSPTSINVPANQSITLNGGGNANATFIFVASAAITFGAGVQILLTNGAQASNVYWLGGAISGATTIGASSYIQGTFLDNGATTLGAGVVVNGQVLVTGSLTFGAGVVIHGMGPSSSCAVVAPTLSVSFTDATLGNATIGTPYSDFIAAVTLSNGALSGQSVTYSTSSALPTGLSLNAATGYVTGTAASSVAAGTYPLVITATSTGYTSQTATVNIVVIAAVVAPTLSVSFTDATLGNATIGTPYSDFIAAVTLSNGALSGQSVTYSTSSALPTGLSLNAATGYVTGTAASSVAAGTYPLVITATSTGYTSQTAIVSFAVLPPITIPPTLSISFTDLLLANAIIGTPYSDFIAAVTLSNATPTNQVVSYAAVSALPNGLTLNQTNGQVVGVVSGSVSPGNYSFTFQASAVGYTTQISTVNLSVFPAFVTNYSLSFNDATLNDAVVGTFYSDNVSAVARTNFTITSQPITYSTTSVLPPGLSLNSSNGFLFGVPTSGPTKTYLLNIMASAYGYPSQTTVVSMVVSSNAIVGFTKSATVLFALNKSLLTSAAVKQIAVIAKYVVTNQLTKVNVVGTTSFVGGTATNTVLALARASAVMKLLRVDIGTSVHCVISAIRTNLPTARSSYSAIVQY